MTFEMTSKGTCLIEGVEYPGIGFGTYPFQGDVCIKAVSEAVDAGYRIIDTATFYRNFEPIGHALNAQERESFYITSKVWHDSQTAELVQKDIQATLEQLQTDYLDAYLIHWPNSEVPIEETLTAMDALRAKGIIRHIGLSNVTTNHLKRALQVGVPISWVQVEMHPLFYDAELLEYCQTHGIVVQAWAPLRRGAVCQEASLIELGRKYGKLPSQIALRWILQHGCLPLPGSTNKQHMRENLQAMDFVLSEDDMAKIDAKAKQGTRQRLLTKRGLGFTDEFDFSYEECWPK